MTGDRRYPDEVVGQFEPPPIDFVDEAGRDIAVRRFGNRLGRRDAEREALVAMYRSFDPADRAQGIPPSTEGRLGEWIDVLTAGGTLNVIAWHGDAVAGHATLVPDDHGAYELAIFVHQDYQRAGIGGRLIRGLLGAGQAAGIERVWLTVERWNRVASRLYHDVGFETVQSGGFDLEMSIRLGDAGPD